MKRINEKFYDFYCYDNNEDLIMKLCKKFNISEPAIRYNCYGGIDVVFKNNLKVYLAEVLDDVIILKRREDKNFGQKSTKEYMNTIKKYIDGNIWYELIKKISKDSKI